jgi:hypothetical protein
MLQSARILQVTTQNQSKGGALLVLYTHTALVMGAGGGTQRPRGYGILGADTASVTTQSHSRDPAAPLGGSCCGYKERIVRK